MSSKLTSILVNFNVIKSSYYKMHWKVFKVLEKPFKYKLTFWKTLNTNWKNEKEMKVFKIIVESNWKQCKGQLLEKVVMMDCILKLLLIISKSYLSSNIYCDLV